MVTFILYNPLAGQDTSALIDALKTKCEKLGGVKLIDVTGEVSYGALAAELCEDDRIILAGGDGTLNRFVNAIEGLSIRNEMLFYPVGSGNDFAHDLGYERGCEPFRINEIIARLPVLNVGDRTWRFVNGAGFGLDGFVCNEVNLQHARTGKSASYTWVAVKSLLFRFKPVNAKVTLDGVTHEYRRVWLAPTMQGRYFGGGMMIAPEQDRASDDDMVSSVIYFGRGKLFTLYIFPSIFTGKHVRFKKNVIIQKAHEVTVEFDTPCAMQIDGEVITDVRKYTVRTAK